MAKRCVIIKYISLLLLFVTIQPAPVYAQRQRLGEAAGITWKQVWLAPGWGIEVPAYWEEEKKLSPETLGRYKCDEVNEFISLSFQAGSDEFITEAIRTSNAERSKEIMSLLAGWMIEAGAKKGNKVIFKDISVGWVDDYGALLFKYLIENTDSFSLSFAQYMIPVNNGVYYMTICVDTKALDYIAMTLARRSNTGGLLGENGGIPGKEISKGYPLPKKLTLIDYVLPYLEGSLKIWAVIMTVLLLFFACVWMLVRKKRTP